MLASEKYYYTADKTFTLYSFVSYGPNGSIHKLAKFNKIDETLYGFGFGDYEAETGKISDTKTSNNQDTAIVMATIGSIIYDFTNIFPKARVVVQGVNTARTRLYQMYINRYWSRIEPVFVIYGLTEEKWVRFTKDTNYDAFLGHRK